MSRTPIINEQLAVQNQILAKMAAKMGALDTDLTMWANASAWSLVDDNEQVEITDVKYDFDPETIEPGVYDVTFSTEGYEYKVSTTRAAEEGSEVGLVFRPEDIHVMKKGARR